MSTVTSLEHPSSIDLEAFACGETVAAVTKHLGECDACSAFVERLQSALSAGPSKRAADAMIATITARASQDAPPAVEAKAEATATATATAKPAAVVIEKRDRKLWSTASTIVVPLAAAAALIIFLRSPSTNNVLTVPVPTTNTASPTTTVPATATIPTERKDPETTFKGGIQIAVIRERDGQQARYTDTVSVKPGDRLRVEVALDRDQAILAAVMGDDASWLELMAGEVRQPGTYFSERSARVDASPLRGTILVGSPTDIAVARETKDFSHVASIRVDWESAP